MQISSEKESEPNKSTIEFNRPQTECFWLTQQPNMNSIFLSSLLMRMLTDQFIQTYWNSYLFNWAVALLHDIYILYTDTHSSWKTVYQFGIRKNMFKVKCELNKHICLRQSCSIQGYIVAVFHWFGYIFLWKLNCITVDLKRTQTKVPNSKVTNNCVVRIIYTI